MNNINNNDAQNFEIDDYQPTNVKLPDFNQFWANKLQQISNVPNYSFDNKTSFDPHQLMVKRNQVEKGEVINDTPTQTWPENEIKQLEAYCNKMGIVGFNCGRMPPLVALSLLKKQYGDCYENVEVDNRIPMGYENINNNNSYNPNYPYQRIANKKSLLLG